MGKVIYFAYGSNMDVNQLKRRVGEGIEILGPAVLKNHTLKFNKISPRRGGCANVEPAEGEEVWGILYSLSEEQIEILDEYEGAPHHYRRVKVKVQTEKGEVIEALTYVACEGFKREGLRPSDDYLNRLLSAREILPREYVKKLESFRK